MANTASKSRPGTMRERSPGHWELRAFSGRDPITGKPKQATRTFVGGERAAAKALGALVTEVDEGKFKPKTATVGQLLDQWLEAGRTSQRPRTLQENQRKIDKRIRPALGDVRLNKLDAAKLDATYRAWLDDGLSPATVHKYHCILSAALRQAVKWDYIDVAPTARATPPRVPKPTMKVPTPDQLSKMVKAAENMDPVVASAIALAALTGARRGELIALRWSDLDLVAGRVRISKSLTIANNTQHVGPTKTHAARDIALDPIAVEVLKRRWSYMVDLAARAESPLVDDPYVLSYNANGAAPANPDTLSHGFNKVCREMELPAFKRLRESTPKATHADLPAGERWPFRFHDLRHFSVTTLIAAGVDVRTVADRHGHSRATMTLDLYAHALPERDREAANLMGATLDLLASGTARD
ncbi:MAG: site-specific integrase [Acidimicrobiales bacterium]|jgi:integrase